MMHVSEKILAKKIMMEGERNDDEGKKKKMMVINEKEIK
jgi:hypothetical protein